MGDERHGMPPGGDAHDRLARQGTKIEVDGTEYGGVDEMPPEVRRIYEDARAALGAVTGQTPPGGTVDVKRGPGGAVIREKRTQILQDGKPLDPSTLSPEAREVYERYLASGQLEGGAAKGIRPVGEPTSRTELHTMRTTTSWSTDPRPSRPRGPRLPTWVNVVILAVCAGIMAMIWLAY